ncbi:hypothetical protein [Methanobrevibacter sp.]|uniref:hypothetical protein n=1 Tax=Methanobrevibacter sp. TaxID=66852 RepID=UPI00388F1B0C
MKLPLSQADKQLIDYVESCIREKAEYFSYSDFSLESCTETQRQIVEMNGLQTNGKYDIEWVAECCYDVETSFDGGDYFTPPSFDVDDVKFIDFEIKFIGVTELAGEERYVEYEN